MTPDGGYKVLHAFAGGTYGTMPYGQLVAYNSIVYGVTELGGQPRGCFNQACGTVFGVDAQGNYSQLYSFQGGSDGSEPDGALAYRDGYPFGTTYEGASSRNHGRGWRTLFKLID